MLELSGTTYSFSKEMDARITELSERVQDLRRGGSLNPGVLHYLRTYFRIKNIYHSNAVEGNCLTIGETRMVVEMGMTITGKPLKDTVEAKNLGVAVDFLEELVKDSRQPVSEKDICQVHQLVLQNIIDDQAGRYRTVQVEISGSSFPPPGPESVAAQMAELGEWLTEVSCVGNVGIKEGIVYAAAAHAWLVYIHPFVDGNGRVARLLMNLILMRYGFPIAIITKDDRLRYYEALEQSQCGDLTPFLSLVTECVEESLEEYNAAAQEHRERQEWAKSLVERMTAPEQRRIGNEYQVWKSAMELLRSYMQQTASLMDSPLAPVHFRQFGTLEFEKYLALYRGESAKRTWFFRVDFLREGRSARYLFFFGYRSHGLQNCCKVTLLVAREEPAGSYYYERLTQIDAPNVPDLVEIGYDADGESFVALRKDGTAHRGKIEDIGRQFFEQIVQRHFAS